MSAKVHISLIIPDSQNSPINCAYPSLLKSPSGGLRRGRPGHAPLVPAAHLEPLLGAEREVPIELVAGVLAVDEVAEAATDAAFARVEAAAGFAEVGDGAELAVYGARGVPAAV